MLISMLVLLTINGYDHAGINIGIKVDGGVAMNAGTLDANSSLETSGQFSIGLNSSIDLRKYLSIATGLAVCMNKKPDIGIMSFLQFPILAQVAVKYFQFGSGMLVKVTSFRQSNRLSKYYSNFNIAGVISLSTFVHSKRRGIK